VQAAADLHVVEIDAGRQHAQQVAPVQEINQRSQNDIVGLQELKVVQVCYNKI
jgi:hypothetical protein